MRDTSDSLLAVDSDNVLEVLTFESDGANGWSVDVMISDSWLTLL